MSTTHDPGRGFCRRCFRPLRKWTQERRLEPPVKTLAEARRRFNEQVTSIASLSAGFEYPDGDFRRDAVPVPRSRRQILAVNVWDGENYLGYPRSGRDPLFCTASCCITFAAAAFRAGTRMVRK